MRSIGNKGENKLEKNQRTRKGLGLFFKVALPIAFVLFLASVVCYMMFHGTEDTFFQQNLVIFVRGVPAAAVALFFILSLARKCKKCYAGLVLVALPFLLFYYSYLFIALKVGFQSKNVVHQGGFLFFWGWGLFMVVNGLILGANTVRNKVTRLLMYLAAFSLQAVVLIVAGTFWWYVFKYHALFNGDAALAVLSTNWAEAVEFITANISIAFWGAVIIGLIVYFRLLYHWMNQVRMDESSMKRPVLLLGIIAGLAMTIFPFTKIPVMDDFRQTRNFLASLPSEEKFYDVNAEKLYFISSDRDKVPQGTVILVIGESATRDRMKSFNEAYAAADTPWESKMKKTNDFIFFNHAYSNFPLTAGSLMMYLTSRNQYNPSKVDNEITILDIAKNLGYKTYWLSNQGMFGGSDATTSVIGSRADKKSWTPNPIVGPDEQLLTLLQKIDGTQKNFIIVHIRGSHYEYDKRYPEVFGEKYPNMTSYEKSIAYTDKVLQEIYEYGRDKMNLQAMLYCADHGEDMKYGHSPGLNDFNMVRIPFWIYLARDYQLALPERYIALRQHSSDFFTNDLIYDVFCGLLGGESDSFYQSRLDISSPDYAINKDNALTLHGKRHVLEDPTLAEK